MSDEGMGMAVKNSLEIIIKQVRLEGGFERGGRIRVAECLRQIVPDRWASIRKWSFTKCFCVYVFVSTFLWQRFVCQMQIVFVLLEYKVWRRSDRYWGAVPVMELKLLVEILYWMRCVTANAKFLSFKNRVDVVRFLSFTHKPCCCILNFLKFV